MAEPYDKTLAAALVEGDYVRIGEADVILDSVVDNGSHIFVKGVAVNRSDADYEAELDPYTYFDLLME